MQAIERNLVFEAGAVFDGGARLSVPGGAPYDLTGAKARMHIRDAQGRLKLELTDDNGRILIDVETGAIRWYVGALVTADVQFDEGFYDLTILPGGDLDRAWKLFRGEVEYKENRTYD